MCVFTASQQARTVHRLSTAVPSAVTSSTVFHATVDVSMPRSLMHPSRPVKKFDLVLSMGSAAGPGMPTFLHAFPEPSSVRHASRTVSADRDPPSTALPLPFASLTGSSPGEVRFLKTKNVVLARCAFILLRQLQLNEVLCCM